MRNFVIGERLTNGSDSFKLYLNEIGKIKLLSQEDYTKIIFKLKSNDERVVKRAKEELIRNSLRFVVSVAKQYVLKNIDISDLISEGNLGLIKAAEKYDPDSKYKFLSYAVWWVRKYILNYITSTSKMIKLPQNRVEDLYKIKTFVKEHQLKNLLTPSKEDFLNNGFTNDEYNFFINSEMLETTSLDSNISESTNDEFKETFKDRLHNDVDVVERFVEIESNAFKINSLLNQLPEKDKFILKDIFGIGTPQLHVDEISKKYNLCTERIRQIKDVSIKKLREYYTFMCE